MKKITFMVEVWTDADIGEVHAYIEDALVDRIDMNDYTVTFDSCEEEDV